MTDFLQIRVIVEPMLEEQLSILESMLSHVALPQIEHEDITASTTDSDFVSYDLPYGSGNRKSLEKNGIQHQSPGGKRLVKEEPMHVLHGVLKPKRNKPKTKKEAVKTTESGGDLIKKTASKNTAVKVMLKAERKKADFKKEKVKFSKQPSSGQLDYENSEKFPTPRVVEQPVRSAADQGNMGRELIYEPVKANVPKPVCHQVAKSSNYQTMIETGELYSEYEPVNKPAFVDDDFSHPSFPTQTATDSNLVNQNKAVEKTEIVSKKSPVSDKGNFASDDNQDFAQRRADHGTLNFETFSRDSITQVDHGVIEPELEEQMADVLERIVMESGIDLS